MSIVRFRVPGAGLALLPAALLAGCASIPTSGPTQSQIVRATQPDRNQLGMTIVDVDQQVVTRVAADTAAADAALPTLASLAQSADNDVIGPGDVLAIAVYEVGVGLFGAQRTATEVFDPSARGENFPTVVVDRDGTIKLPYVGKVQASGRTPAQIASSIEQGYRSKSQSPQVLVARKENISQTVYVTGDTHKPGRIELTLQNERLLDAVALAGGAVSQTQDMVVRLTRAGRTVSERLDRIIPGAPDDLVLEAGDRIELIREPQTFVAFGAASKIDQVAFNQTNLTLAEAIARSGGPNDNTANPKAVFLFRYLASPTAPVDQPPSPVIYRIDMMNPASYFLTQRLAMRDKDVIYVSTARINRIAKFVSIINQLTSPFVTARALSN